MIDENRVRRAVEMVKANGWTIRPGRTFDAATKCCCPMGAVVLAAGGLPQNSSGLLAAACELDVDYNDVRTFAHGFDAKPDRLHGCGYDLGRKFREELIG